MVDFFQFNNHSLLISNIYSITHKILVLLFEISFSLRYFQNSAYYWVLPLWKWIIKNVHIIYRLFCSHLLKHTKDVKWCSTSYISLWVCSWLTLRLTIYMCTRMCKNTAEFVFSLLSLSSLRKHLKLEPLIRNMTWIEHLLLQYPKEWQFCVLICNLFFLPVHSEYCKYCWWISLFHALP